MAVKSYIGCVYMATNTINGKAYIGKSKLGLAFRRRTHEKTTESRRGTAIFGHAIAKYGPERLEKMRAPRSEEAKANMRAGNTEEVRKRKSEALKGIDRGDDWRRKMSEVRKGMKFSDEHKANMAKSRTGVKMPPWTPERRAKMEAAWARNKERKAAPKD